MPARPEIAVEAMGQLCNASTAAEIITGLTAVCEGLGMKRFLALRTHGLHLTRVCNVLHNIPEREAAAVESGAFWPNCPELHGMLKGLPPFLYASGESNAPFIPAPGFSCGVVASTIEPRQASVLVFGREEPVPSEHAHLVRSFALMATTYVSGPLARLPTAGCPLPERELECLRMALAGLSAKETARQLNISWRTVEVFLSRARGRLGVDNTFAACLYAVDQGWITLEAAQQAAG